MRLAVRSTVVASALAIAAIAAPAASARFDLGPQQRPYDVNPSTGYAIPVAPPQAQPTGPSPEVHPNPDQQATPSGSGVAPILRRARASQIAATERAKEQALANHVPPNGRQSNADANTSGPPQSRPRHPRSRHRTTALTGVTRRLARGSLLTLALLITAGSIAVRQRSEPRHP